eukprot:COSAG01_NODE_748_length_13852_cov_46.032502_11_plen_95_part_00
MRRYRATWPQRTRAFCSRSCYNLLRLDVGLEGFNQLQLRLSLHHGSSPLLAGFSAGVEQKAQECLQLLASGRGAVTLNDAFIGQRAAASHEDKR